MLACLHVHLPTKFGFHTVAIAATWFKHRPTVAQHSCTAPDAHKVGRLAAISIARVAHLRKDEVRNLTADTLHLACKRGITTVAISLPVPIPMAR